MKKTRTISALSAISLSILLILTGCKDSKNSNSSNGVLITSDSTGTLNTDDMFTDRDLETGYDEEDAQSIILSEENCKISITSAGAYILSGTASDGSITVDVPDTDKVQIVLNGVSLTSKASAALYVKSADKVFITVLKGTNNALKNGGTFENTDENIDGVIFSKADIVFCGEGTLNIESPSAHGIVGKDDVKFTGGTYKITCASHSVDANDSIRITNANLDITAGKDGLHCENDDDTSKGYVYIKSGSLKITSQDDGIHANTYLTVDGGTIDITAAEGLEATYIKINDGTVNIEASDDGINAAKKSNVATPTVEINGGNITIVMGKGDTDGIDSNGDIIINGGTVDVTGNSSFDYEGTGVINGGTVIVNGSQVSTLPNQFMGGGMQGGKQGGMPGGMSDRAGEQMPNDAITSATPDADNSNKNDKPQTAFDGSQGEFPQRHDGNFEKENGERPQKPSAGFGKNSADKNREIPLDKNA